MKDYSSYYPTLNECIADNGKVLFEQQLLGVEGEDAKVDGVNIRILVQNSLNPYSEDGELRAISCRLTTVISRGSVLEFDGDTYLMVSDIDENLIHKSGKAKKCNTSIKYLNEYNDEREYPCFYTKFGKGNDGTKELGMMTIGDNKTSILIQNNEHTIKFNKEQANRFIIGNKVYSVSDVDSAEYPGLLFIILEEDEASKNDNFDTRIAENIYGDVPVVIPTDGLVIEGDGELYYNDPCEYEAKLYMGDVLEDPQPIITYTISIPELVTTSQIANVLTIIAKVPIDNNYQDKLITLTADDGTYQTTKNIMITSM